MKRIIYVLLVIALLLLSVSACSGNEGPTVPQKSNDASEKPNEEKTHVIYIGGDLGDAGIADATYEGFDRALKELPIYGEFIELPDDKSMYKSTLLDACEKKPKMIFTSAANGMIDEVIAAAAQYPEIYFMVLDCSLSQEGVSNLKNMLGVLCNQSEVSYLCGYLAQEMSKSKKIGIVVGIEYATLSDFCTGYIDGALAANPNAQVAVSASGDWVDQAAAKETALAQIRQGCDVIYCVGAASSFGSLEAVKESGIWGIGCDTDLAAKFIGIDNAQADCIITSAYKDWGTISYNWIARVLQDPSQINWGSVEVYGLKEEGVKIIENDVYKKQVPKEIQDKMSALVNDIKDGKVKPMSFFDLTDAEYLALKEKVAVK